ncbi:unnamed protein product [Owenia fusiformis]|uniref:Protection of telomeres protein 1 n=1 Tax=Owenia fusiformis TaxID=6347 RepID=A0A8S4NNW6_OWEFU|nr:unnamed protein product [Owenia fusiformis]
MSCKFVTGDSIDVPAEWQLVDPGRIQHGVVEKNNYIKGTVHTRYPLVPNVRKKPLIKFILQLDADGLKTPTASTSTASTDSIGKVLVSVFLVGKYAQQADPFSQGDCVVLSDFYIENSTSSTVANCTNHVVLDEAKSQATIIILHKKKSDVNTVKRPHGPVTAKPASNMPKTQKAREYSYTPLSDLLVGNTYCVYGVCKFYKPPKRTKGSDYNMIVSLVDPNLHDNNAKLKCSIFLRDESNFPKIRAVGDIVRFHRLKITSFSDELQGQIGPGFSSLVWPGQIDGSLEPRTNNKTFTVTDDDKKKVLELRKWYNDLMERTLIKNHASLKVSDFVLDQYFDLTCQVVGKYVSTKKHFVVLRIWDGTKPSIPVYVYEEFETQSAATDCDEELTKAARGRMVDVAVFDEHFTKSAHIQPGAYITLVNLHAMISTIAKTSPPTAELCVHGGYSYGRDVIVLLSTNLKAVALKTFLADVPIEVSSSTDKSKGDTQKQVNDEINGNVIEGHANDAIVVESTSDDIINNATSEAPPDESKKEQEKEKQAKKETKQDPKDTSQDTKHNIIENTNQNAIHDKAQEPTQAKNQDIPKARDTKQQTLNVTKPDKNIDSVEVTDEILTVPDASPVVREPVKRQRNEEERSGETPAKKVQKTDFDDKVPSNNLVDDAAGKLEDVKLEDAQGSASLSGEICMLETASVLTTNHHVKPSKLRDVEKCSSPNKFRIMARVYDYQPRTTKLDEFLRLCCPQCHYISTLEKIEEEYDVPSVVYKSIGLYKCPKCVRDDNVTTTNGASPDSDIIGTPTEVGGHPLLKYSFMLKLLLRDNTGWVVANLWGDHAETFFKGIRATAMLLDDSVFHAITNILKQLCPSTNNSDILEGTDTQVSNRLVLNNNDSLVDHDPKLSNRPLLDCCILSHHGANGLSYQIFNTRLALDIDG